MTKVKYCGTERQRGPNKYSDEEEAEEEERSEAEWLGEEDKGQK